MNHVLLARVALTGVCVCQAVATAVIDWNRTHATNPLWTGHARFHLVWQGSTVLFLSLLQAALIWAPGPEPADRFYVAALLVGASPLGFLAAFFFRKVFAGTLYDSNGIPPARLRLFGSMRQINMNLVAVLAALGSLGAIIAIYRT